tara:strand:+ start:2934 stop:3203 length:270 start_codon:yes stop_codon:yes gene_type:complete
LIGYPSDFQMTKYLIIFSFILFFNCKKNGDCIEIEEKKEVNGEYYFYFSGTISGVGGTNEDGFLEDRWASGKVSKSVYESHNIGDEYCY